MSVITQETFEQQLLNQAKEVIRKKVTEIGNEYIEQTLSKIKKELEYEVAHLATQIGVVIYQKAHQFDLNKILEIQIKFPDTIQVKEKV